jgi:phosphate transport system substrate-binding protein
MTIAPYARVIAPVIALAICLSLEAGWSQNRDTAASITLKGAGANFPAPLYKKWIALYHAAHPEVSIVYDPVGSGEGIKRFLTNKVDFAASDEILPAEEAVKAENGALMVPATAGMVALAYNIPGVTDQIRLPRDVYVAIFARSIRRWNDPRIQAANPDVHFPARDIAIVGRGDSSGTTAAFTRHLAVVDPTWTRRGFETGRLVAWPGAMMLASGNEGVAALIKISKDSIGYVEYGFAERLGLRVAALQNKAGMYVAPGEVAALLALSAPVGSANEIENSIVDPSEPGAYPIMMYSWLFLHRHYGDRSKAAALHDFVKWGLTEGQNYASDFGYVGLSADVASLDREMLDTSAK